MTSFMSIHNGSEADVVQVEFTEIAASIRQLAHDYRGNCLSLLHLLRLLEGLHREICDTLFQESLPDSRQALHALLRDIESQGGWPYIYRLKLQALLANFPLETSLNPPSDSSSNIVEVADLPFPTELESES
ncbi:MAG: hypothetical protein SFW36_04755 [Leptolyngbyaceae cyanobacterium bins.59]|nr:hypothetical protein [Leptolyngbyaceae cyanobacterium bins.59]